ncbi:MAG: Gfo/Idh/MocA family oxidoreductase [Pirellulales bacterium]|nr:Gfo/Idh/MocA family oxidoreductase [Pirellulales bacterium]
MRRCSTSTRRQFLKRSAAAAAGALVAPQFIPRSALASADRPGANDRIGVGYIGPGRRAWQLMDLPPEGEIVAAADVELAKAEKVATRSKCKSFKAYHDYRKLLENKDVDAVVVATPDHWRAIACIHACQAGKDIYAEKPLALTIKESRAIADAVKRYNRVCQVGTQQRSMPQNRRACELIRNGALGRVHTIVAKAFPSPWFMNLPAQEVPKGLNWDAWCGPAPVVPFNKDLYIPRAKPGWISVWPFSGGEMTGWGAHGFDQIQWALGMDDSGPVEVSSTDGPFKPPTFDTPVTQTELDKFFLKKHIVTFRYENGPLVKLTSGSAAGGTFVGEKGKLVLERGRFSCNPAELAKTKLPDDAVRLYVSNHHMKNWFDCMKSRKDPVCTAEIGHRSGTVCHLGNIARWLGRPLKWDPIREIFPEDDEANRFLDVPRRAEYPLPEIG